MWKMQLLDENHLLIKYASEEVVTLRSSEPNSQASFFVVYNFKSTEVVAVYENTSEDLLNMFENYCDFFRNTNVHDDKLRSYQRGKANFHSFYLDSFHTFTIFSVGACKCAELLFWCRIA